MGDLVIYWRYIWLFSIYFLKSDLPLFNMHRQLSKLSDLCPHVLCFPPSYVHIWCFRFLFCVIISSLVSVCVWLLLTCFSSPRLFPNILKPWFPPCLSNIVCLYPCSMFPRVCCPINVDSTFYICVLSILDRIHFVKLILLRPRSSFSGTIEVWQNSGPSTKVSGTFYPVLVSPCLKKNVLCSLLRLWKLPLVSTPYPVKISPSLNMLYTATTSLPAFAANASSPPGANTSHPLLPQARRHPQAALPSPPAAADSSPVLAPWKR